MNYRNGIWFRILAPTFIYIACVLPFPAAYGNEPTVNLQIAQASAPRGTPVTIRGKISATDGPNLKVTATSGEVLVRLPENVRIGGAAAAQLSDIGPGSYVGTTAVKQPDGNLKALEVHIFPEASRGTGEGQRSWDLEPGSTMTNANVEKIEQITVETVQGRMLLLKYKGGEAKVFVPPRHADSEERCGRSLTTQAWCGSLYCGSGQ